MSQQASDTVNGVPRELAFWKDKTGKPHDLARGSGISYAEMHRRLQAGGAEVPKPVKAAARTAPTAVPTAVTTAPPTVANDNGDGPYEAMHDPPPRPVPGPDTPEPSGEPIPSEATEADPSPASVAPVESYTSGASSSPPPGARPEMSQASALLLGTVLGLIITKGVAASTNTTEEPLKPEERAMLADGVKLVMERRFPGVVDAGDDILALVGAVSYVAVPRIQRAKAEAEAKQQAAQRAAEARAA